MGGADEDPSGPVEVPLLGGHLACVLLGHRWQRRDADNARDHVEYVLRVSWRPPDAAARARGSSRGSRRHSASSTRAWLVARRFRDFHALHRDLRRATDADAASSTCRSLPRFPSRHAVASLLLGRNRRDAFVASRERLLERYLAALLAADPGVPDEPAVDRFLELSTRLRGVAGQRATAERRPSKVNLGSSIGGCQRADSHVEGEREDEDEGDQDLQNAEWLDYQLKLRLMEMVDDSDACIERGGPASDRLAALLESVELLRPPLKQAARDPRRVAQATRVLKKLADSLAIFREIRQRSRRRATR